MKESFVIAEVSREDLEILGFDASKVSDETMERLATKLGDSYCENFFYTSLKNIAKDLKIPKKPKAKPSKENSNKKVFKSLKECKFQIGDKIRPINDKDNRIETIYAFDYFSQCYVLEDWTKVELPRLLTVKSENLWEKVG